MQAKKKHLLLVDEINIGLNRNTSQDSFWIYDGGIPALQTLAPKPPKDIYNPLTKDKSYTYVLNCGGTNWEAVRIEIGPDGTLLPKDPITKAYTRPSDRLFVDVKAFANEMVNLLLKALDQKTLDQKVIEGIGVSLGFPQKNIQTNLGIDAEFLDSQLTKGWNITNDPKGIKIGETIKSILKEDHNIDLKNVLFGNDAALMPWDLSVKIDKGEEIAPIGGVFGSGLNIGFVPRGKTNILNPEIGRSQAALNDEDQEIFDIIKAIVKDIHLKYEVELFVGGDYLFMNMVARVIKALGNDADNYPEVTMLKEACQTKGNSEIVSFIVEDPSFLNQCEFSKDASQEFKDILYKAAQDTFESCSEKIAILITACVESSGLSSNKKWVLPFEGSVINKAYGVLDRVNEIIKEVLPDYSIRIALDASSKKALGVFAKYLSLSK